MMGKLSRNISEALRRDDFERISDYIVESCNLLLQDFQHQRKQMPNHENKIRNILLEEYLDDDITPAVIYRNFCLSKCPFASLSSIAVALATAQSSALQMNIYPAQNIYDI